MSWRKRIDAGETFELKLSIDMLTEEREAGQIISETKEGDPNNINLLGADLYSVQVGPGVNDNVGRAASMLETARSFKKFTFRNKVHFAWWGAEESGMIDSRYLCILAS